MGKLFPQRERIYKTVCALMLLTMLCEGMDAFFCSHLAAGSDTCAMHQLPATRADDDHGAMNHEHMSSHVSEEKTVQDNQNIEAETIKQPSEPCPHCLSHSPLNANATLQLIVQPPSSEFVFADTASNPIPVLPFTITLMDLHGHSPPNSTAARYVLNSTFRI
jgi:hypothetical protein